MIALLCGVYRFLGGDPIALLSVAVAMAIASAVATGLHHNTAAGIALLGIVVVGLAVTTLADVRGPRR